MPEEIVEVIDRSIVIEEVIAQTIVLEIPVLVGPPGAEGPQGPPGTDGGGGNGQEYVQSTPLATWYFTHALARRPGVEIYISDERVIADVVADSSSVSITFSEPVSGSVVLT